MVMERLDAAGKHPENQDSTKQFAISAAKRLLRDAKVKDPGPRVDRSPSATKIEVQGTTEAPKPSELDLDAEWQRQSSKLVELGFHSELGMSEREYLDTLPKFETQPSEYKGIFDRPILSERRIPWERQAELAGIQISDYLKSRINETKPWEDNPSRSPTGVACAGWFNNWGQRFSKMIKPFDARKQLTKSEGAGDVFDAVAKEIHFPEDGENGKYFDIIGTSVGSGHVVYLGRWDDQSGLSAFWGDNALGDFRPLVRGSKVVAG